MNVIRVELPKMTHLFKAIIEHWEDKEVHNDGNMFILCNNQEDPMMSRLNRISSSLKLCILCCISNLA